MMESVLARAGGAPRGAGGGAAVDLQPGRDLRGARRDGDRAARGLAEALARRAGVTALELARTFTNGATPTAVAAPLPGGLQPRFAGPGRAADPGADQAGARERRPRVGSTGTILNTCFQNAFRVARRVRRETEIASNPVSVSSVAVEFARQMFGGFDRRAGAGGRRGEDVRARGPRAARARRHSDGLTNRTRARAEELAGRFGAAVSDWSDLAGALTAADIVIASTGAQRPVLTRALLCGRCSAPDTAARWSSSTSPSRATSSPACGELDGVYVADIDDLQKVAAEHRDERENEAARRRGNRRARARRDFSRPWRGRQLGPDGDGAPRARAGPRPAEAERMSRRCPGSVSASGGHRGARRGARQEAAAPAADGAAQGRRRRGVPLVRGGAATVRAGDRRGGPARARSRRAADADGGAQTSTCRTRRRPVDT